MGARLKTLRQSKGIKGSWVAGQMGIGAPYLSDLESGRRHWNPDLEKRFLKACGVQL